MTLTSTQRATCRDCGITKPVLWAGWWVNHICLDCAHKRTPEDYERDAKQALTALETSKDTPEA